MQDFTDRQLDRLLTVHDPFSPVALEYLIAMFGQVGILASVAIAAVILARKGERVRAVEWLAFAFTCPVRASRWLESRILLTDLRSELEQSLGSTAYQAAWERGKLLDIETIAAEMMTRFCGKLPDAPDFRQQPALNARELEILCLVSEGLSNRDIAGRLFLSPTTVKWYLSEIYSKLGVRGRVQALSRAYALQLLA